MAKKSIDAVIGEKIRGLRKAGGLSQMKLADMVGVSYQQIQKYEKASGNISVERLEQIAKAFKVPLTTFFSADAVAVKKAVKKGKK
ncbi:MAG TPA: helix-turn-helix transcriptional regulator [Dissulfurispiraceae bacterium]|nr:helix-turn-helix transcriptional regulator [Dissulfurispiraceae bacterium]